MNREQFLELVRSYVEHDPECAPMVTEFARRGVSAALDAANRRATDMEVALAVALAKRYKNADEVIRDKLSTWEGKTALNWSKLLRNPKINHVAKQCRLD